MLRTYWLGQVPYLAAWDLQRQLADARADGRIPDILLLLEHPPTLTMGRAARREHLLASAAELERRGISVHHVDRGGDITYHGPGQLVGYPILDLGAHGRDLHGYLRRMEEALIRSLAHFDLVGRRFPPHTGVWTGDLKIAAIGVHVRRWVTTHGFALNVRPDMSHFRLIVPCGIHEFGVTSLADLLPRAPLPVDVAQVAAREFGREFMGPAGVPVTVDDPLKASEWVGRAVELIGSPDADPEEERA